MAGATDNVVLVGPLSTFELVFFFIAFTGIAFFNGVELLITIFMSFRRSTSCYFYSLVAASVGILIYQLFVFLMIYGKNMNIYGILTGIDIGWALMVVGQSMVLWSRLHLVCYNRMILRSILYMIITTGILCVVIEVVLTMRAVENGVLNSLNVPFIVCEKVTVAVFFVQEIIISGIYLWETTKILRVGEVFTKRNSRRRMKELIAANIFIICLDVTLLCLEYLALWGIWCSFKGMAYSIKVKIEFSILNQLKSSLQASSTGGSGSAPPYNRSGRQNYGNERNGTHPRSNIEMDPYGRSGTQGATRSANHDTPNYSNAYSSQIDRSKGSPDQIVKTTEFTVTSRDSPGWTTPEPNHELKYEPKSPPTALTRKGSRSGSSAEVPFATHAA